MPAKPEDVDKMFTQVRELFEAMVTWLSSDKVCDLEHGELENQLLVNGDELLRRLLQGYMRSGDGHEAL